MRRSQHEMAAAIDGLRLALRGRSPQREHEPVAAPDGITASRAKLDNTVSFALVAALL